MVWITLYVSWQEIQYDIENSSECLSLRSRDEFLRLFPGKGENFPVVERRENSNSGRSRSVDEDGDTADEEQDNDERRRERWRWRRQRRIGELQCSVGI